MDSLNERLLVVLQARRDEYVRLVEEIIAEGRVSNPEEYSPTEAAQMIDGMLSLLAEALVGEGTEVRSFFLQTLIPSLIVREGSASMQIVAAVVQYAILMVSDAVRLLADDDREAATRWLASFFGDYVVDVALIVTKSTAP